MNNLTIFKNRKFGEIRTMIKEEKPYFCLADACRTLEIKNVSDCKNRLKSKGIVSTDTLTGGGIQSMLFINESNLYKVIFQSRKENALKFQDWITEDVIPEIRKNGSYSITPQNFKEALFLAYKQQEKIEELNEANLFLEKTKAWINDKKSATAMNTASQKSKELRKLKIELDRSREFASIKKVEIKVDRKFDWHKLRNYCNSNELEMPKIFDANYGQVRTYPAKAWLKVYDIDLNEIF